MTLKALLNYLVIKQNIPYIISSISKLNKEQNDLVEMNLLITTTQVIGSNKVGEANEIAKIADYQEFFKFDIK